MTWSIRPELFCSVSGCQRPKQAGEDRCVTCLRAERFARGLGLGAEIGPDPSLKKELPPPPAIGEGEVLSSRDHRFDLELNAWLRNNPTTRED